MPGFHAHHFATGDSLSLKLKYDVPTAQYAIVCFASGTTWEIAGLEREDLRVFLEQVRDEFVAPDAAEAGGDAERQDDASEPQIPFA